jgi:exopolyphosphatase / guanosine-5'-triphosphate,3'-diphosphate pyrophosphatase
MRVAVVDIGTNSTRLLIADVNPDGSAEELVRRSQVTRLGAGVDASGSLSREAVERTWAVLSSYRREIDDCACEANLAVLTSAVRDASNGAKFVTGVRDDYRLDARILTGDEEAQLTFLGAMSDRQEHREDPTVVIDIGGGSTEFVIGTARKASFHVSLQTGVVRMSERHIHSDPPLPAELQRLAQETRGIFQEGLPEQLRTGICEGIAVAGTATSAAAIAQGLEPYDPARVHKYPLGLATVELLLARLAEMTEDRRRRVVGLEPGRAPTIVAGMILLSEAMRIFALDRVEVSERDILFGGALHVAGVC